MILLVMDLGVLQNVEPSFILVLNDGRYEYHTNMHECHKIFHNVGEILNVDCLVINKLLL